MASVMTSVRAPWPAAFSSIRSMSLPGVATTISAPALSAAFCTFLGTPP